MFYLITEQNLEDLKEGKVKIEELTTPKNISLITWSGEDIELISDKHKKEFNEGLVNSIKHNLESCDCANCVECAFDNLD